MSFMKRLRSTRSAPVDTDVPSSAPVDTDLPSSAPVDTDPEQSAADDDKGDVLTTFGASRTPREHAIKLLETMRELGYEGRSIPASELHHCHAYMCAQLDWIPWRWPAIGRELKRLGLRKGKVWVEGCRVTVYEIAPAAEAASNVIPVERKRARGTS